MQIEKVTTFFWKFEFFNYFNKWKIIQKYFGVYNILYETLIGAKSVRIRFNKKDRFIRVYYGARYLILFHHTVILIEPFLKKYKNNYYYNIFFEKSLYK